MAAGRKDAGPSGERVGWAARWLSWVEGKKEKRGNGPDWVGLGLRV